MTDLKGRQYLPRVNQFSFSESGYDSAIECIYNESSDLRFEYIEGIQGGRFYSYLNNIQCEATFTPTLFDVTVDELAKSISVKPTTKHHLDSDDTGGLINNAFMGVSFVSQILTTMYTGILGDALLISINAVRDREGHTTATEADNTTGLAESLARLVDDYFGAIEASQLLVYNQSRAVDSKEQIQVIRLGQPVYIYVTLVLNLVTLAVFGFEASRTRFRKTFLLFNCLDTQSAILGATANNNVGELPEIVQSWKGDDGDRGVKGLKVLLNNNRPVLQILGSTTHQLAPDEAMLLSIRTPLD